jgi:hypothetical protein
MGPAVRGRIAHGVEGPACRLCSSTRRGRLRLLAGALVTFLALWCAGSAMDVQTFGGIPESQAGPGNQPFAGAQAPLAKKSGQLTHVSRLPQATLEDSRRVIVDPEDTLLKGTSAEQHGPAGPIPFSRVNDPVNLSGMGDESPSFTPRLDRRGPSATATDAQLEVTRSFTKAGRTLPGAELRANLFDDRVSVTAASVNGSDLLSQGRIAVSDDLESAANWRQELDLKAHALRSDWASIDFRGRFARGRVPGNVRELGSVDGSLTTQNYQGSLHLGEVAQWTDRSEGEAGVDLSLFADRLHLASTYSSSKSGTDTALGIVRSDSLFGSPDTTRADPFSASPDTTMADMFLASPDTTMREYSHRLDAKIWQGRRIDFSVYGVFSDFNTDDQGQVSFLRHSTTESKMWEVGSKLSRGPVEFTLSQRSAANTLESTLYDGSNLYAQGTDVRGPLRRLIDESTDPTTKGKVRLDLGSVIGGGEAGTRNLMPSAAWLEVSQSQRSPAGGNVSMASDPSSAGLDRQQDRYGAGFDWQRGLADASIDVWRTVNYTLEPANETADRDDLSTDISYNLYNDVWGASVYLYAARGENRQKDNNSLETELGGGASFSLYFDKIPDFTLSLDLDRYILDQYDNASRGVSDYLGSYVALDFSKYLPTGESNYKPILKFVYKAKVTLYADSETEPPTDLNHAFAVWSGLRW